jgi:hypothetical protein
VFGGSSLFYKIDLSRDDAPRAILAHPNLENPLAVIHKAADNSFTVRSYLFVLHSMSRLRFLGFQRREPSFTLTPSSVSRKFSITARSHRKSAFRSSFSSSAVSSGLLKNGAQRKPQSQADT